MARILVVEDEPPLALGLEDDLKLECWSAKQQGRIKAALKNRTAPVPASDITKTVTTVIKGDVTKGVDVPTVGKKRPASRPAAARGKM